MTRVSIGCALVSWLGKAGLGARSYRLHRSFRAGCVSVREHVSRDAGDPGSVAFRGSLFMRAGGPPFG
jgi:hypothetical protein